MKRWMVLIAPVALVGCAGERVTDLGEGRHHLAIRSEYGETEDRAHALELADKFCRKSGQRAAVERFDEKGSYVVSPSVGVVFTCK